MIDERTQPTANPWKRALVIYGVLMLGCLTFPGGIVDWLEERNDSGMVAAPLIIARGLDAVSASLGIKFVGQKLRGAFAAWVGQDQS